MRSGGKVVGTVGRGGQRSIFQKGGQRIMMLVKTSEKNRCISFGVGIVKTFRSSLKKSVGQRKSKLVNESQKVNEKSNLDKVVQNVSIKEFRLDI